MRVAIRELIEAMRIRRAQSGAGGLYGYFTVQSLGQRRHDRRRRNRAARSARRLNR